MARSPSSAAGLEKRELDYVLEVKGKTSAYREERRARAPAERAAVARQGARYRQERSSLRELALAAGQEGRGDGQLAGGHAREDALALFRAAGSAPRTSACATKRTRTARSCRCAGCSASGPPREPEPIKYWLSNLPADTPLKSWSARQAALADRAGLPRAKGRTRPRPLRGPLLPRLEPPRHARLGRPRLPHPGAPAPPSSQGGSLTLFGLLRELQTLLACWHGHLPHLPQRAAARPPLRAPPT